MLLISLSICLIGALVNGETLIKGNKTAKNILSPVRPLPCHSVTMIKETRPTEFLFIAPGNSGDCSFIFESLEGTRLDIKVRNLKSNLPRGNGDPCEDGQVRLYNYKGSGQITLSQRLCDNEKEVTMLTDGNMAIVASSLIDGSFSVVARSLREADLSAGGDDQFLQPPGSSKHDWTTKTTPNESQDETKDSNQVEDDSTENKSSENSVEDKESSDDENNNSDNDREPSQDESPPDQDTFEPNYFVANANMTDSNHTMQNCSYNYYGYYVCNNISMNGTMNSTHTNHTGYYYDPPSTSYHAPYTPYEPRPIYAPPHEPIYHKPYTEYRPPKPEYYPPNSIYSPPQSIYSPPEKTYYSPSKPSYSSHDPFYSPDYTGHGNSYSGHDYKYSAPESVYNAHEYVHSHHHDSNYEKPFRPSQPIPSNFWEGYNSPHSYDDTPIWYDDKTSYPGQPTKHVDLTHDTYPMYPSYFYPGYYYGGNSSSTTPPSLTTTTEASGKRTTMDKPKTTVKGKDPTTKPPVTTKPTTTKHHHHIFGIPLPWTANVSITSGDNLAESMDIDQISTPETTTQRIKLNRIINNLLKT